MAEKMNGEAQEAGRATEKRDGFYRMSNGRYLFVMDGVMHLAVHSIPAPVVLSKGKRVIMLTRGDGDPLVFMRAGDVIAAWPEVERQVRKMAAAYGLEL